MSKEGNTQIIESKRPDEVYCQLLKRIQMSLDPKKIDSAFDERFGKWWKDFEAWERRQLSSAPFVTQGRFTLDRWVEGVRNGFHSDLRSLLRGQLRDWVDFYASLPIKFHAVDEQFDIEEYIRKAKEVMEIESIPVSLDKVFYVPSHALLLASNVNELEKQQLKMKQQMEPLRKRFEQMTRGKQINPERKKLYEEMQKFLDTENSEGGEGNEAQASRKMMKKHGWTDRQRTRFLRAFNKLKSKGWNFSTST
jgi:hypothetical protein